MKLKYLLPVATLASVATVVTPLVTSCGSSNTIKWDWIKNGDYKQKYEPLEAQHMSVNKANSTYFNAVKNKKLIFCDDVMFTISLMATEMMTTKTVANCSATILSIDAANHLLSFNIKINLKGTSEKADGEISMEMDITYKNLEYTISGAKEIEETKCGIKSLASNADDLESIKNILNKHKGWSINGSMKQSFGGHEMKNTYDFNENKQPTEETFEDIEESLEVDILSSYMKNITIDK